MTPKSRKVKVKIDEWTIENRKIDYIKLEFCTAKDSDNKTKKQHTEWEMIFLKNSNKGLISKVNKEYI